LYNDKKVHKDQKLHVSIRPEKFMISHNKPEKTNENTNLLPGKVEEVIYLGAQSRYWVRVGDWRISVIKQHFGYALDERSIKWGDDVWLKFEADTAYMLDSYTEDDEKLLALPDI
jgi:spermidine/putrescine transport system ATP-binding protein